MIDRFELVGFHVVIGTKIRRYASKRLATLDRYLPGRSRQDARMEVRLRQTVQGRKHQYSCDVTLHAPRKTYILSEDGPTIYAAIDKANTCLKHQMHRYKDEFANGKQHRHMFARLRRHLSVDGLFAVNS